MNTLDFLNKNKTKNLDYVRTYLFKNKIKTLIVDDPISNGFDENHRIICNSNRNMSDFDNPISFECNGLIVSCVKKTDNNYNYSVLMCPPQNFNSTRLKRSNIVEYHNKNLYDVYKIYDGTNINMYFYNKEWVFSTTKGYAVNDIPFIHNKTYKEIMNELFNMYETFSYNNLDKDKCYSFIFKYGNYHIFNPLNKKVNNYVILLQSVDLIKLNFDKKMSISYNDDIGIPLQEKIDTTELSIKTLYNKANDAYLDYNKYYKENNPTVYKFHEYIPIVNQHNKDTKFEPNYGYILRSSNFNKTKKYTNIVIESSLLSSIRQLIYDNTIIINHNKNCKITDDYSKFNTEIKVSNSTNFNKLKAIITINKLFKFKLLFPEFDKEIEEINHFIHTFLPTYILINKDVLTENLNNIQSVITGDTKFETAIPHDNRANKFNLRNIDNLNVLSLLILTDITKLKININVFESRSILSNLIRDMKYIYLLHNYLYN